MEEWTARPKCRPLVRAASEESSSGADLSSISASPVRGDTLPWNLPKHHRIKRSKSASGDVLDPAERAIFRIAGQRLPEEQDYVQAYENVREKYKGKASRLGVSPVWAGPVFVGAHLDTCLVNWQVPNT
ncbi:hypothetical protein NHX12_023461 [Muraenolepis orangiensis]|uniref:Uncharacterized protein n=1 Tax=Muraenolepis orangiensis TaxID=630683 RepID=A0A9Q0EM41_9TELE|nr:hypothetical protein NHX12_023461 [Muraenolepis orangiensis]